MHELATEAHAQSRGGAAMPIPAPLRLGVVLLFVVSAGAQVWFGVVPGLRLPAGDFANAFTAARIARAGEDLSPAYTDVLWFQQRIDAAGFVGQLGSFI